MKPIPTRIFAKGLLFTAVFSIAATGAVATGAMFQPSSAYAQETSGGTPAASPMDTSADNATGTAAANASSSKLAGIIASLQIQDVLAPEWVTAGYWELESDASLFGGNNQSEPTVTSFDAIVEMTRVSNGTFLHEHTFSNFRQSDILFMTENTTTINGTLTVTTEDGPTEDVPTFMTLENNLIAIFVNPNAVDNHFGPTPIYGMVLTPEKLQQISDRLSGAGGGTEAAGQQNNTSTATANATGQ